MKLKINGRERELDIADDTPLLWVLRDRLGLKGTKFGCGMARCGACTVLLNNVPIRSCVMPASAVVNQEVLTIEGLSENGNCPIQQAWIELDVPQCGYCQSGQMLAATALLAQKPEPTDSDIDAAMSGNICRCGTYQGIRAAIHRASELSQQGYGGLPG